MRRQVEIVGRLQDNSVEYNGEMIKKRYKTFNKQIMIKAKEESILP